MSLNVKRPVTENCQAGCLVHRDWAGASMYNVCFVIELRSIDASPRYNIGHKVPIRIHEYSRHLSLYYTSQWLCSTVQHFLATLL